MNHKLPIKMEVVVEEDISKLEDKIRLLNDIERTLETAYRESGMFLKIEAIKIDFQTLRTQSHDTQSTAP